MVVTKTGEEKKQEITRIAINAADNILGGIPTEELNTVVEVLNKLNKNMKKLLRKK